MTVSIVYPVDQNPTLFLDATTLLEPPNEIELTHDLIKPIFDPVPPAFQISQTIPLLMPGQGQSFPFPVARSNMCALVRISGREQDDIGAFICAFKHPFVGNEDIIYIVPPTESKNYSFVLFSPLSRDSFRIENSSRSSFNVEILVTDGVRIPAPVLNVAISSSGGSVLANQIVNAFITNYLLNMQQAGAMTIIQPIAGPIPNPP